MHVTAATAVGGLAPPTALLDRTNTHCHVLKSYANKMVLALPTSAKTVKWASDMDKFVLCSNFNKRGWVKGSVESELRVLSVHAEE